MGAQMVEWAQPSRWNERNFDLLLARFERLLIRVPWGHFLLGVYISHLTWEQFGILQEELEST